MQFDILSYLDVISLNIYFKSIKIYKIYNDFFKCRLVQSKLQETPLSIGDVQEYIDHPKLKLELRGCMHVS